jgi:hypothetical protein
MRCLIRAFATRRRHSTELMCWLRVDASGGNNWYVRYGPIAVHWTLTAGPLSVSEARYDAGC